MPQMNRGGKFIFGVSVIGRDGLVQLPPQAAKSMGDEYLNGSIALKSEPGKGTTVSVSLPG